MGASASRKKRKKAASSSSSSSSSPPPAPDNVTMLQAFEWHVPADHRHWARLQRQVSHLKAWGVDNIWIPPACKAADRLGNGYDVYDLWDLGEFEQKGGAATKWGGRPALAALCGAAERAGVGVYFDAVLNHRLGADVAEPCRAVEVDPEDRRRRTRTRIVRVGGGGEGVVGGAEREGEGEGEEETGEARKEKGGGAERGKGEQRKEIGEEEEEEEKEKEIRAWTGFTFPGRGDRYSAQKYHWRHFSGVDVDADDPEGRPAIYNILGRETEGWATDVDEERGNYDYLMGADLDYANAEVAGDVLAWGRWLRREALPGLRGIRLDAAKHYSRAFARRFVEAVDDEDENEGGGSGEKKWFFVGEYWSERLGPLTRYVEATGRRVSLFDVPLVCNLSRFAAAVEQASSSSSASSSARAVPDLRRVFRRTLVSAMPEHAVTFVMNHDTQPGQSLATPVPAWLKPLAYALILLRREGGYPCVWYGDLYGVGGGPDKSSSSSSSSDRISPPPGGGPQLLARLVLARKLYAYGPQIEYYRPSSSSSSPPSSRQREAATALLGWTRLGDAGRLAGRSCCAVLARYGARARRAAGHHQQKQHQQHQQRMYVGRARAGEVWTDVLGRCPAEVVIQSDGYGVFSCGSGRNDGDGDGDGDGGVAAAAADVSVYAGRDAPGRERFLGLFNDRIYEEV